MKKIPTLFWPACVLILILAFNAVVNPAFLKFVVKDGHVYGSLVDIVLRGTPLIIVALGMTLVIATGGIDLSVGTVAALSAASAVFALSQGYSFSLSMGIALSAGIATGLFNSFMIVGLRTQPIIASLIAMVAGRGIAQLLCGGQIISIQNAAYLFLGNGYILGLPFCIWFVLIILGLALFVMKSTSASLFIEALGSNPLAAHYVGINTKVVRSLTYLSCSILAAVVGIVISSNIHAVDVNNLGLFLELDAILAVVIGGTKLTGGRFSLVGSVLGAVIIQAVSTTINTQGIPFQMMLVIKASVVIIICLLQSENVKSIWSIVKRD